MCPARALDWRDVFEQSSAPSAVLLPDLTVVAVTDGYARCLAVPRTEIVGKRLLDVLRGMTEEDLARLRASFERVHATRALDAIELTGNLGNEAGDPTSVRVVNRPIFEARGALSCFRHDVEPALPGEASTSQRPPEAPAVAARIQQLENRLEELNQELESFSHSVSHDLRAPLRAVDGFSQLVLADYADKLDAEGRDYLEQVCAGAKRMSALLDDLLTLSRIGRASMRHVDVDLSSLASTVIDDLRRGDPSRDVRVTVEPGMRVVGDPRLLRTLLEHLLANAWKFTRPSPDPCIAVGCERDGADVTYVVRDNGVGFEMKYAGKLWSPFQRMHGREFEGRGIGLALCRRIVVRHGGRAWADAVRNEGATFRFVIGARQADGRIDGLNMA